MDNDWWGCARNHGAHDEHAPNPPQAFGYDQGESEVGASDEELLSPQQVVSKVWLTDDVEHMLDKGVWVATLATHWDWRIFIAVSDLAVSSSPY